MVFLSRNLIKKIVISDREKIENQAKLFSWVGAQRKQNQAKIDKKKVKLNPKFFHVLEPNCELKIGKPHYF